MCGIIGEISHKSIKSTEWINKAGIVIHHRGPDNFSKWVSQDKKVAFGHNRLSIIDLSTNGNQPMFSTCLNYVIIFNGELYNYKNLKKELIEKGLSFNSRTDTEVLLNSYKYWGENCLQKLKGMFAFSIYDKKKNIVFFARDRSGEKPLYFHHDNNSLSFCSELKGLLQNTSIERKLSIENFNKYLHQGYTSGQKSLIKNIEKLKAGEFLKYNLSNGGVLKKKYFNIPNLEVSDENEDEKNIINNLEILLNNSVKNQINADVPVGILLSGGIDSSLITALASNSSTKINTFTFINSLNNSDDFELNNSRNISKYFSTNHNEIYYPEVNTSVMDEISNFTDEPIFDSSIIPTYLITKEIKKYCTVALGGDGGDELFGGYDHYPRLLKLAKINQIIPKAILNKISKFSNQYLPIGFKGRNWLNLCSKNLKKDYLDIAVYFDDFINSKILNKNMIQTNNSLGYLEGRETIISDDNIYKSCAQDFNNFLSEDILLKNDRFSMANSVELRSPFLDTNIINFAFRNVSSSLKVNFNEKKIILKKLSSKILPKSFELNKKRGFSIPINEYFKNREWQLMAQDILMDDKSLFKTNYISKILKKPFFNHNNSERIFGLMVFELWKKKYRVSVS